MNDEAAVIDSSAIAAQLEAEQQRKLAAIENISAAANELRAAEGAVTAAQTRYSETYQGALDAGWTRDALHALGLPKSGSKRR